MSKKNKILWTIIMLLGATPSFTENQSIDTLSVVTIFILIVVMKLTDYLARKKLIKQINNKNMTYIKVKENRGATILCIAFLIFSFYIGAKSAFSIRLFVILIFILAQGLFSYNIITDDKVIFYDNLVFKIDEIEEIKYEESVLYKNKKIIVLGKGFTDRKMVVKIEDFDKVKSLLESKNAL